MSGIFDTVTSFWAGGLTAAQNRIANRESELNATLTNKVTAAQNANDAAQASLANYTRSLNNQRRLVAMGQQQDANTTNTLRTSDAELNGSFSRQIGEAEQSGRVLATQAAVGAAGATSDAVNQTTDLRNQITDQLIQEHGAQELGDAGKRAANIAHAMFSTVDWSSNLPSLNYNKAVSQTTTYNKSKFPIIVKGVIDGVEAYFGMPPTESLDNTDYSKGASQTSPQQFQQIGSNIQQGYQKASSYFSYTSGGSAASNMPDDIDAGGGWSPASGGGDAGDVSSWFDF